MRLELRLYRVTIWHPQLRRPFRLHLEADELRLELAAWEARGARVLEVLSPEGEQVGWPSEADSF